jgi:hypothetical protein
MQVVSHKQLKCTIPEGSGTNIDVEVNVGGVCTKKEDLFAYDDMLA